jgi:serpin B
MVNGESMKNIIIAVIISALIIISIGVVLTTDFGAETEEIEEEDEPQTGLGEEVSFNEAVNEFCFDFFKKLSEDPINKGNIFYSPYSVFTALAMTYEGARSDTAVEMENVLSIEQDNDSFHQYMRNLYDYLNKNSEYDISTANALWIQKNFDLLQEYIDIIETYYGGESSTVDYFKPVEAANTINSWVENQTNNLIKDLVPASALGPLTRLVLTNAIYFKGIWHVQFEEENTTEKDFKTSSGQIKQVETMQMIDIYDIFNYTETDVLQILELPYKGDDISMMIILPKEDAEISDIIRSMNQETYSDWIDSMHGTELDIYLPKFKFETSYTLNDYLIALGMQEAFTSAADFSGITGAPDLFISSVLHKAFIEVNEEGTEAAAATAVIMKLTADGGSGPRIVFNADHPFFFTIHHKETGTILFMGEVTDPSQ